MKRQHPLADGETSSTKKRFNCSTLSIHGSPATDIRISNDEPMLSNTKEFWPGPVNLYSENNLPPNHLQGYWKQRNNLFKRYSEGIWMTDDSWFEVTPEAIANTIAHKCLVKSNPNIAGKVVVDAFCGVGGNSIQFALSPQCKKVYAIDIDADAIACAKHNAQIYHVEDKIEFLHGDFFQLCQGKLQGIAADTIFLSPPWGGPGYRDANVFNLENMQPYPVSKILRAARLLSENLALYIPRTSDLNQVARYNYNTGPMVEAIHYALNGRSKAITAYFGHLSVHSE